MTATPEPTGSNLVSNEQIKLTATYLNGLAIAVAAVGGLAPLVALVSGASSPATSFLSIAVLTSVCVAASVTLHLAARRYMRGLRP